MYRKHPLSTSKFSKNEKVKCHIPYFNLTQGEIGTIISAPCYLSSRGQWLYYVAFKEKGIYFLLERNLERYSQIKVNTTRKGGRTCQR